MFRKCYFLFLFLTTISFASSSKSTSIPPATGAAGFFFTENKGQWDSRVLYKCSARNGMTWFLERDGITLLTMKEDRTKPPIIDPMDRDLPETLRRHPTRYPMKSHALKFKFLNSGRTVASAPTTDPDLSRCEPPRSPAVGQALLPVQSSNEFQNGTGRSACPTEAKSVEAFGELPWHNNYFLGNDSSKWAPNCRNFTNIIYRDVWDGIDIEWYEQN